MVAATSDGEHTAAVLADLATAPMEIVGRFTDASNGTYLCLLSGTADPLPAVYKPIAHERPLWDFPDGTLAGREVAAYAVAQACGISLIPPTVLRADGPFGPGMVQRYLEVDESVDLVALVRSDHPDLRRLAVLDALINNADRKGGHLLPLPDGSIRGVDHGVCFHTEPKLRTVLWNWRGSRLDGADLAAIDQLIDELGGELAALLEDLITRAEVSALRQRARHLSATGRYPEPSEDWPAIPWPPF